MASKVFDNFLYILILSVLFFIQFSISSPLENDKLIELTERFERMQTKIEAQEVEIVKKFILEMEKLATRVGVLEGENEKFKLQKSQQDEEILGLKSQISKLESLLPTESASKYENNHHKNVGRTSRSSKPPASCADMTGLAALANSDGIYLVQDSSTNAIQAVFCKFSATPISQTLIGRVDVQSKPAHFYVQRFYNFDTTLNDQVIPFDEALLNEGGVFDLNSGNFTAPVNGIYHFEFSGVKHPLITDLGIRLQINGVGLTIAKTSQNEKSSKDTVSMNASFKLKANDIVNLSCKLGGLIFEDLGRSTHFSGWLVSEDLDAAV